MEASTEAPAFLQTLSPKPLNPKPFFPAGLLNFVAQMIGSLLAGGLLCVLGLQFPKGPKYPNSRRCVRAKPYTISVHGPFMATPRSNLSIEVIYPCEADLTTNLASNMASPGASVKGLFTILVCLPKGSKYHHSRYLVGIWVPKVYTILLLGPFGLGFSRVGGLKGNFEPRGSVMEGP